MPRSWLKGYDNRTAKEYDNRKMKGINYGVLPVKRTVKNNK
jgi:hypothetical protein